VPPSLAGEIIEAVALDYVTKWALALSDRDPFVLPIYGTANDLKAIGELDLSLELHWRFVDAVARRLHSKTGVPVVQWEVDLDEFRRWLHGRTIAAGISTRHMAAIFASEQSRRHFARARRKPHGVCAVRLVRDQLGHVVRDVRQVSASGSSNFKDDGTRVLNAPATDGKRSPRSPGR
ncbi:MAG: hypothetical protein ACREVZ_15325, partial [Burkholderiales bacterium]